MAICLLNDATFAGGRMRIYNILSSKLSTSFSQFVRSSATSTVGEKLLGTNCKRVIARGRSCRGKLTDTILDWEANLPEDDLEMSDYHSR